MNILDELNPRQLAELERRGVYDFLENLAKRTTGITEEEGRMTPHDFIMILQELKIILEHLDINIEKIGEMEVETEG